MRKIKEIRAEKDKLRAEYEKNINRLDREIKAVRKAYRYKLKPPVSDGSWIYADPGRNFIPETPYG